MEFYASCLGGDIVHLQTVGESHLEVAPEHEDRIFHSILVAGDARLMASDGEVGKDPVMGQNFALFLTFDDADAQARVYEALRDGGQEIMPLSQGFGMLEDRFGIRWMLAQG
jgi:PhnB protein